MTAWRAAAQPRSQADAGLGGSPLAVLPPVAIFG